jgi:hypothetical protein
MIDVQGPLLTAGLVAVIGALVQLYSIINDRRRTKSKDARADAKEPLVQRHMELTNLDQATVIQQRMIDAQGEEIQKLTLKVATLTAENKVLREQMMDMFLQVREMERRYGVPGAPPYYPNSPQSDDPPP